MARWSGWGGRTDFQTPNHKTKSSATPRKQGGYLKKICLKVGFKGARGQKGGFRPEFGSPQKGEISTTSYEFAVLFQELVC